MIWIGTRMTVVEGISVWALMSSLILIIFAILLNTKSISAGDCYRRKVRTYKRFLFLRNTVPEIQQESVYGSHGCLLQDRTIWGCYQQKPSCSDGQVRYKVIGWLAVWTANQHCDVGTEPLSPTRPSTVSSRWKQSSSTRAKRHTTRMKTSLSWCSISLMDTFGNI